MLRRKKFLLSGLIVLGLGLVWDSRPVAADSVVVGTGTPASCNEAAFDAGLAQLFPGEQAPGGTLTFNCGPNPHTIILTSQKFLHDGSVIDGGGKITLSGGNTTRIFWVSQQARVEIQRIILTNGSADHSGAIFVEPNWSGEFTNLTLNQVTIKDSQAASFGGGIGAQHANLTLINSLIEANRSSGGGGGMSFNTGSLTIRNSQIRSNRAEIEGAGLEIWGANPLSITQSSIESNKLLGLEESDFGGGLLLKQSEGMLDGLRVSDNLAFQGGGMYLREDSNIAVLNSTIDANIAADAGGAIYSQPNTELLIEQTQFFSNFVGTKGGAIANSGVLLLERSSLFGNWVTNGHGGGIANDGHALVGYSSIGSNDAEQGAGIYNFNNGLVSIDHVSIVGNDAVTDGGGIYHAGAQFSVNNSILFANSALNQSDCGFSNQAPSMSFSMWSSLSCGSQAINGNLPNTRPLLHAVGWYGGSTPSYLPNADSPSIDAGSCPIPGGVDQRGFPRIVGVACDMGSVESGSLWYWVALPMTIK